MFLTTYHNHSVWSDGTASIRQMALAARAAGAREFGISDHLVAAPRGFFLDARGWSMALTLLDDYAAEALRVKEELSTPAFQVRIGMEVDYFPETWEAVAARLARLPLDYVIGAVHFAADFPVDASAGYWRRLSPGEQGAVWEEYARRVLGCARDFPCQWLAHLDLAKIYGVAPTAYARELLSQVLEHCARRGVCIEVNAAGLDKFCGAFYPEESLLKEAVARGVGILVTADAHAESQVVRHFGELYPMLKTLGVSRIPRFEQRRIHWHPL